MGIRLKGHKKVSTPLDPKVVDTFLSLQIVN
jgi:hypothetical protein